MKYLCVDSWTIDRRQPQIPHSTIHEVPRAHRLVREQLADGEVRFNVLDAAARAEVFLPSIVVGRE